MRKCAITGAGGFVAGSVIHLAPADWEIHALSGKDPFSRRKGLVWHTLDLQQPDAVQQTLAAISPDVVIHAAAIADIDFCERHPDVARTVNVALTQAIADSCIRGGSRLVSLSSDNVFDGERGDYTEADPPTPINEYARTKATGETIAATVASSVVARVALVMGFGPLGGGNSFLERTVPMLRAGKSIDVPPEEIRTPIDVLTLGDALLELAAGSFNGTIHLAGSDALDRVTLTRRIAERFGYSPGLVRPRAPDQIAGRAPRPRDVSLSNALARSVLRTPMLGFNAALDQILASLD
jgi:dTDP-4-dehydrorhamnose reductase